MRALRYLVIAAILILAAAAAAARASAPLTEAQIAAIGAGAFRMFVGLHLMELGTTLVCASGKRKPVHAKEIAEKMLRDLPPELARALGTRLIDNPKDVNDLSDTILQGLQNSTQDRSRDYACGATYGAGFAQFLVGAADWSQGTGKRMTLD